MCEKSKNSKKSDSRLFDISSKVFLIVLVYPFILRILDVIGDFFANQSMYYTASLLCSGICVAIGYLKMVFFSSEESNKLLKRLKKRKKYLETTLALNMALCLLFLAISIYCMIENLEIGVTLFAGVLFSSFLSRMTTIDEKLLELEEKIDIEETKGRYSATSRIRRRRK